MCPEEHFNVKNSSKSGLVIHGENSLHTEGKISLRILLRRKMISYDVFAKLLLKTSVYHSYIANEGLQNRSR